MTTRADILEAARAYEGTPFHHQGRQLGVGVDCIGLIVGAATDAGVAIKDRADYSRQPSPATLLEEIAANLDRIEIEAARAGDVLLFWIADKDSPQHVGIVTERGMIHAWALGRKRVQEHGITEGWRSRVHSAWRFRGLED